MDNPLYIQLTRQSGLLKEMDMIAGNLANMNTTGYRREGVIFSEFVEATPDAIGSISMTAARARYADDKQGPVTATYSPMDMAIEGEGFFQVQTANGVRLTRAGAFTLSPENTLVTLHGYPVLDNGGAPIQLPPNFKTLSVAPDGALAVDGVNLGRVGVVRPTDPQAMRRDGDTVFDPGGPVQEAPAAKIAQGFVEGSNVDSVTEITRMIEVQRAYELGQNLMDRSDEMIRTLVRQLGEPTA